MRNTTEAIWIFSFIFLYSALSFFFIKQILKKRKLKKEQEQHEEIKRAKQRKAEIAEWQAELHEEANEKRRLKRECQAKLAAENAAKCETLSGFLAERQDCYITVLAKVDAYAITSARRRLDPNERTEQIIWQSLETVFDSTNAKTMQSRIELVRNHAAKLIRSPIDEHMFRIIATHYYLVQINALEEKIANYKTQAAKNKAKTKIEVLFVEALNDDAVYQQAVLEYQKSMNEPDRLSLSDETLADNEKMP